MLMIAMPLRYEPVAWASETAASLAEIISSALNRSETRYERPAIRPTLLGSVLAAQAEARTSWSGLSTGFWGTEVSSLRVLAGRYLPCGSLAPCSWRVPASASS